MYWERTRQEMEGFFGGMSFGLLFNQSLEPFKFVKTPIFRIPVLIGLLNFGPARVAISPISSWSPEKDKAPICPWP